ncbi:hypothetical protein Enr10x_59690 [Gimesia panareensis]|uniref:Uncharacterized protein n=1 Tax=Gimesia panareensis TaxID=2527978 RepID=A0A517QG43_9PLAN|nr:hypothetical protein Enr10x_59690 [Gimesia panareensis]
MPKLGCRCGHVIDLTPIPCSNEYSLISDSDIESVFSAIESSPSEAGELLESVTINVVVCDVCGRYYISKGKESVEYEVLVPETTEEDKT